MIFIRIEQPKEVLTLTWYTYICACLLGRVFEKFGLAIRGFSETKEPELHNWVYFGQILVESTLFGQNWVLPFEKGILMGGKLGKKIGMEKVRFSRSVRHIHDSNPREPKVLQ